MSRRPVIDCRCCHRQREHRARGLCASCWSRSARHGHPATVPPPAPQGMALPAAWAALRATRIARIEDYVELTREFGLSLEHAAERMGVSVRTAWRYEAELRRAAA